MIENPTREDLVNLIQNESGPCVSILMRTNQSGRETNQNPIRFKNLITQAIDQGNNLNPKLRDRLGTLANLEHDFDFWQQQSAGLAIFVCDNFEQRFKLSQSPDETVHIGDQFLLRTIASASCGGESTRTLALTWDRARWFACDGHQANEIEDDLFPVTMDQLVSERDGEKQLQFTTHGPKAGGNAGPRTSSTAMYHGHGEGEEKIEADRDLYLKRVGKLVADQIYNTNHSLVLMATDEVAGHFTSTSDVEVVDVIQASPDGLKDEQIKEKIVHASCEVIQRSEKDLTERLGTALANGTASPDVKDIIQAAFDGRVDLLLIGDADPIRGRFDRDNRQVEVDSDAETDLVNLAVRETLQAGGTIARMPEGEFDDSVAAIYRY